ncbi:MAG TPA: hypothetical protein VGM80_06260 [Gaiellaceae bacterium]
MRTRRSLAASWVAAVVATVAILAGLAGAGAAGAGSSRLIAGDRSAGGAVIASATPAQAAALFGKPTTRHAEPPYSCVIGWRQLGLVLDFIDLDGGDACVKGTLIIATVTSRSGWHTARGLRVGDPVSLAHSLYPTAALHSEGAGLSGYWLIVRHACKEVGGSAFPGLLARTHEGRVSALVSSASVCE